MSAGDVLNAELLRQVPCPTQVCGGAAHVWQIGEVLMTVCQRCRAVRLPSDTRHERAQ